MFFFYFICEREIHWTVFDVINKEWVHCVKRQKKLPYDYCYFMSDSIILWCLIIMWCFLESTIFKRRKRLGLGSPTTENTNTNIERKPNTEK